MRVDVRINYHHRKKKKVPTRGSAENDGPDISDGVSAAAWPNDASSINKQYNMGGEGLLLAGVQVG